MQGPLAPLAQAIHSTSVEKGKALEVAGAESLRGLVLRHHPLSPQILRMCLVVKCVVPVCCCAGSSRPSGPGHSLHHNGDRQSTGGCRGKELRRLDP